MARDEDTEFCYFVLMHIGLFSSNGFSGWLFTLDLCGHSFMLCWGRFVEKPPQPPSLWWHCNPSPAQALPDLASHFVRYVEKAELIPDEGLVPSLPLALPVDLLPCSSLSLLSLSSAVNIQSLEDKQGLPTGPTPIYLHSTTFILTGLSLLAVPDFICLLN